MRANKRINLVDRQAIKEKRGHRKKEIRGRK